MTAAGLPTSGSTAVLFGCRDGFVLAGAGLSYMATADFDRTDIGTDGGSGWIDSRFQETADQGVSMDPLWSFVECVEFGLTQHERSFRQRKCRAIRTTVGWGGRWLVHTGELLPNCRTDVDCAPEASEAAPRVPPALRSGVVIV